MSELNICGILIVSFFGIKPIEKISKINVMKVLINGVALLLIHHLCRCHSDLQRGRVW